MIRCVSRPGRRGVTLMEVVVASTLAVLVVIGIGQVDTARVGIEQQIRQRAATLFNLGSHEEAALVVLHFTKHLEAADRIYLINTGQPGVRPFSGSPGAANVQLRIPQCPTPPADPACFDTAANYRWDQYVLIGDELRFYENTVAGCSTMRVLARQITSFTVSFPDTAPAPPAGEPFPPPPTPNPADNNILAFTLTWNDGASPPLTHEFRSTVAARGVAYSDVNAGCGPNPSDPCDSGTGVDPTGVAGPPPLCP